MKLVKQNVRVKKKKVRALPYLLIAPPIMFFAVFNFYPFIKTVVSSFSITTEFGNWLGWAGLTHWKMLFSNDRFWRIVGTTFKFAGMNLVMTFFAAMVLALISAKKAKGQRIYQTLYALPLAIASSPAAVMWQFIYRADAGLLNEFLGTDIAWLATERTALTCVAVVTTWTHIASSFIFLLAGFRNVSDDLIEASMLDGAGPIVRAVKIMIPMASPQIFFVLFLNIVRAFKTFNQIKLLTQGAPGGSTTTLMFEVYHKSMISGQFESACCTAIVMFIIIFLTTRIQFLFEKKMVHYQ